MRVRISPLVRRRGLGADVSKEAAPPTSSGSRGTSKTSGTFTSNGLAGLIAALKGEALRAGALVATLALALRGLALRGLALRGLEETTLPTPSLTDTSFVLALTDGVW